MARVELQSVDKRFPGGVHAVRQLSLTAEDGELLVLVGPSGCGKSTVLRMIAGLEDTTAGEILIGDQVVNARSPQERNIAMVFQNYALYPHKTVRQNLEFPLRMAGRPRRERRGRVQEVAELLGLGDMLDKRPRALSGGQRQRVAMGRAMVREPAVFLLDEPLSNLDAKLRVQIRTEIAQLQQKMRTTTIYVTHDQVEAMTLGHRVAVLLDGRLQQVARGQELYERPANVFVAGFIGSPAMNLFAAELKCEDGRLFVPFGETRLPVPPELSKEYDLTRFVGEKVIVGLRPEAFSLGGDSEGASFKAAVQSVEALGHENIVYLESPVELHHDLAGSSPEESTVHGALAARLPAVGPLPSAGDVLHLAIDHHRMRLFDSGGNAIDREA